MKITDVEISKNNLTDKKMLGVATIVFDYDFKVKNIEVMDGSKGIYFRCPRNIFGKYLFYPVTEEMRLYMLREIEKKLAENS